MPDRRGGAAGKGGEVIAHIGTAEAGGALTVEGDWTFDPPSARMHLVAEAPDLEQPAVCGKADFAELGQISQAFADTEIIGVVDAQVVCGWPPR